MAGTVETDLAFFTGSVTGTSSNCDNATLTDWSGGSLALDTEAKIQGTGCVSDKVSNTTVTFIYSCNSVNMGSNACILAWLMCITPTIDTRANGGFRIGVGDGTNTGDWYVGGSDTYGGGWQCFVAHTGRAYDVQSGTPNLAAITRVRISFKTTATTSRDNCFIDAIRWGTYLRVRGGTSGSPATFQDMLDYDASNVLGAFYQSSGIIFCQIPIQIGSTTNGQDTYFKDTTAPIILIRSGAVKSDWYEWKLQGGTNATEIYLGEKVGGRGVNGPIIKAEPSTINRNFAVTSCYSYNANTSAYTDETADINSATAGDVALPPIQIVTVGDAIYFGDSAMFGRVRVTIGTPGVYSGITMQWQYYNGSGWVALPGVSDPTSFFTAAAGTYNVDFTVPFWNWAENNPGMGVTRFWIRCAVTAHASPSRTTGPLATQGWHSRPYVPFKITASDTNVDYYGFYGCNIYGASTITLQAYSVNKEFLGCNVSGSAEMIPDTGLVANCNFISSPYRAIRLSSASNYVSNCTFINCQTAINHTVGGASGSPLEYNYDALMFYGNTYDIENSASTPNFYIDIDRINSSNPDSGKINNSAGGTTTILTITIHLMLTGLIDGSDIVILDAGTTTERVNVNENSGTTYDFSYPVEDAGEQVDIGVFKAGYTPFYVRGYELLAANASLPMAQEIDRYYLA